MKNHQAFTPLDNKHLTGFTPSDKRCSTVNTLLTKNILSRSTPLDRKHLIGFTLIELLVSSTIIVLMLLVAAPAYDQVQSRNELKAGALKIQNCILTAKAQALGPATNDTGIIAYQAAISRTRISRNIYAKNWQCQVITRSQNGKLVLETIKLLPEINIYINTPVTPPTLLYEFLPGARGQTVAGSNNQFYLFDNKNRCLKLYFDYAIGELRLQDSGTVINNVCS